MANKQFKMPDTYVIIFFVVLAATILTWLIPTGKFEVLYKAENAKGEVIATIPEGEMVEFDVNGTMYVIDARPDNSRVLVKIKDAEENIGRIKRSKPSGVDVKDAGGALLFKAVQEYGNFVSTGKTNPIGISEWSFRDDGKIGFFNFLFEGLVKGDKWGTTIGIMAFILVVGGSFGIILKTGAVEVGLMSIIRKFEKADVVLIVILSFLFSLGGAVFGMGEEAIPFAMILVPIFIAMGYDSIVGIVVTYGATQIGFATSPMNPFSVMIAQGIAGVAGQGQVFRWAMWAVFTIATIVIIMIYGKAIKKNPQDSVAYESDDYFRKDFKSTEEQHTKFSFGHALVLLVVLAGVIFIPVGLNIWGADFYIPEIAALFFAMGLFSGIIAVIFKLNNMGINDIAYAFQGGVRDLVGAAMVVALAQGILLVFNHNDGATDSALNTILSGMAGVLRGLPSALSAWIMYIFQSVFNFFVVSGSGQAALTMPLMAPLARIINLSTDVAVLAFQLGDGLTNLIVPTSGCLMGVLGVARLEWGKWARFQWKLQTFYFVLGSVFVIAGVLFGL